MPRYASVMGEWLDGTWSFTNSKICRLLTSFRLAPPVSGGTMKPKPDTTSPQPCVHSETHEKKMLFTISGASH